ncbi:carboxyl transferase domain-containing protein [Candidatus Bipolaricaulota bacterium]
MSIFKDKQYLRVNVDSIPDDSLWMKCKACGELVFKRRVRENNNICPSCGEYFFLTVEERIEMLVDEESFDNISKSIEADDPLEFVDRKSYQVRIEQAQGVTGLPDAIVVGRAAIGGAPVILGVMDFRFIGGSMGSVVGEQICHGMETAMEDRCPFVLVASSGGRSIAGRTVLAASNGENNGCPRETCRRETSLHLDHDLPNLGWGAGFNRQPG